jgi:hypothetical protein
MVLTLGSRRASTRRTVGTLMLAAAGSDMFATYTTPSCTCSCLHPGHGNCLLLTDAAAQERMISSSAAGLSLIPAAVPALSAVIGLWAV